MGTEPRIYLEPHQQPFSPLPRPSTVMVVDDEPRVLAMFEKIFTEEGYDVISVTGGRRALMLVAAAPPDLILMEIAMSYLDGMATLRELRRRQYLGPVILLTPHGTLATAREAMALGAYD